MKDTRLRLGLQEKTKAKVVKNTQTPQNNPEFPTLPPSDFWPVEAVKRAFGVERDGWSALLGKGLHPVRVGKQYFVVRDNLRAVLGALSLAPGDDVVEVRPTSAKAAEPKPQPKKKVDRTLEELAKAKWLSVPEAARYIGVSVKTVRRHVDTGRLVNHDPMGARVRLRRDQVEVVFSPRRKP